MWKCRLWNRGHFVSASICQLSTAKLLRECQAIAGVIPLTPFHGTTLHGWLIHTNALLTDMLDGVQHGGCFDRITIYPGHVYCVKSRNHWLFSWCWIYRTESPGTDGTGSSSYSSRVHRSRVNAGRLFTWNSAHAGHTLAEQSMLPSRIAKTLGSTSIRYRSATFESDRYLINIVPRAFAIWDGSVAVLLTALIDGCVKSSLAGKRKRRHRTS